MRYSGACPGSTEIGCVDDSDYTPISWTNSTGSTERVWWINAGYSSNSGDFTLEWMLGVPGLWTGATSSSWTTGSNWDDGQVPTNTVDVVIPSGAPNYPNLGSNDLNVGTSGTYSCASLDVQSGGSITGINSLIGYGTCTISGGTVTASYSDFYSGGNLSIGSGTCNITGNGPWFHNGSTMTMSGGTLDSGSHVQFQSGSTEAISAGSIYLAGNFTTSGGNFTPTGGTVTFDGGSASSIAGSPTFYDLAIAKSAAMTEVFPSANMSCYRMYINSGTFNASGYTMTVTGPSASGAAITLGDASGSDDAYLVLGSGIVDVTANVSDIKALYIRNDGQFNLSGGTFDREITRSDDYYYCLHVESGGVYNQTSGTFNLNNQTAGYWWGITIDAGGDFNMSGGNFYNDNTTYCDGVMDFDGGAYYVTTSANESSGEFSVRGGGRIEARNTTFTRFGSSGSSGINVNSGAQIGTATGDDSDDFDGCIFSDGTGGGRLLTVGNGETFSAPNTDWTLGSATYNVYHSGSSGTITICDATGPGAGEDHDYDPNSLVQWTPYNDTCDGAMTVSLGVAASGDTTGACCSAETLGACGTSDGTGGALWYKIAGNGNRFTASTCNDADFDTKIRVYTDGCGTLTCVGGRDDTAGCSNNTTEYSWCANNGQEYLILVHGYTSAEGTFNLTVTDEVLVAPTSASSDRDYFCADDDGNISLSVSGGTGDTVRWFDDSCGGTSIGTGSPLAVASPASTTTYYARWENTCSGSSCADVTVTVNPLPAAPTSGQSNPVWICPGGSADISATVGGGETIDWYTGSCGGTSAGTGNPLDVNPTGTTTYYGVARNTTTGCESSSCVSVTVDVDNDDPSFTYTPPNVTQNADAGYCSAVLSISPATASDTYDTSVDITYERSDNAAYTLGDPFPATGYGGPVTITWTATDDCSHTATHGQTVTIDALNDLVVDVELLDVSEASLTRCITFDVYDCDGSNVTFDEEIAFSSGLASAVPLTIACGDYDCILVRDELHTLARLLNRDAGLNISGTDYVASFTGTGDGLIGGNLNDDAWVDIIDFVYYVNRYGTDYVTGDTTCPASPYHADITGDGEVLTGDFTFIQTYFLVGADDDCCGTFLRGQDQGPLSAISVDELYELGLGHLSGADLNDDGMIDSYDVVDFANGVRPAPPYSGDTKPGYEELEAPYKMESTGP